MPYRYTHAYARFEHYARLKPRLRWFVPRLQHCYSYWEQGRRSISRRDLYNWYKQVHRLFYQIHRHRDIPWRLRKEVGQALEKVMEDISWRHDEGIYSHFFPEDEDNFTAWYDGLSDESLRWRHQLRNQLPDPYAS